MGSPAQAKKPCLLVWGRIEHGRPVLEPAFQVFTRPSLPRTGGPYHVEGRSRDGSRIFSLDFTPTVVADDPNGEQHFAFAVPLSQVQAAVMSTLRLRARSG